MFVVYADSMRVRQSARLYGTGISPSSILSRMMR